MIRFQYRLGLAAACFVIAGGAAAAPATVQSLDQGWSFRLAPGDANAAAHPDVVAWRPATVPGTVQTDLLAAKLIDDPYVGANEAKVQWVGLSDWQYQTEFTVDAASLNRDHLDLVFAGLDTFAEVSVNGVKLLAADNMFRTWRIPVKSVLHAGTNRIAIAFASPIKRLLPWLLKQPYALPGEFDTAFGDEPAGKQTSNYVRKANYQYGWDWGPRIVTEGVWRSVKLEAYDSARLSDLHLAQVHLDADVAVIDAEVTVQSDTAQKISVAVEISGPDGKSQAVSQDATLYAGENLIRLPARIEHPKLWWPVGYGKPDLYKVSVEVWDAHGVKIGAASHKTGLRTVELRRDKDAFGKSFEFVVNGVPIFAKGANLIPYDSFPSRVKKPAVDQILQSAVDAHMNMLRMWGGGHYQDDAFYEKADELGLMIWQDFMFGGAITPYDVAFRENSRIEAAEQVKRLRDHPSIVIWVGNNEVETGWENWGDRLAFKKTISPEERERIVTGTTVLFGDVLRSVVAKYSPDVPYWASTPSTDFDALADQDDDGDRHYWSVWGGGPIDNYLKETPRFQSEYGLQSFPVMSTIKRFAGPADMEANSPVMRSHQKYDKGNGNNRLLFYIRSNYGEPKSFADFVYLSQVMQAEGIELAATHLRASRPHSMGSLYWQINDVWPGASWSSIDYYGRWKALQFHAKRFYAPQMVAALRLDGKTDVSLVSDLTTETSAQWRIRVLRFDGKLLSERTGSATVKPLASTPVATLTDAELLHGADPLTSFASVEWLDKGQVVSRGLVFFDAAKTLKLSDPKISTELKATASGYELILKSKALAREVWVDFGDLDASVSDNAFDLLPGQPVTLHVTSAASLKGLKKALAVRSLYGAATTGQ